MAGFGGPQPQPIHRAPIPSGVWRGVVTRVANGRPYVEIPRLNADREYGPLEQLQTAPALAAGQRVLLAFVEGRADDPIILGRLA